MARRPASLALRLTVSIGAVITSVLLLFGWIVERSINNHFIQQDVEELNAVAQSLRHTLSTQPANEAPALLGQRLGAALSGHHNAEFRLWDANGKVIYATPGSSLHNIAERIPLTDKISTETIAIWQDQGLTYRGAVVKITPTGADDNDALTLAVAIGIDFHLHYIDGFRSNLRLITLTASLIAILATWLAVYQGHAPIRRISREIRKIRSDQLHIRLQPNAVPAELTELAISFNEMVNRLEDVFRRLSNFSGDIAHELRTPITNLTTQTQVALAQARSIEQYQEVLYSNLEEYERMTKMVGDMLFLAQADNKLLKPEQITVDLAQEITALFDYFEAWAEERAVQLKAEGPPVWAQGDPLMLRRALSNLLSNAIRYTPQGSTVIVSTSLTAGKITLSVQNPGPTIPAQHIPHLFERFYRPDASRQRSGEGAGLGLAIVKSIIDAHGGAIQASSDNGLTVFEITLKPSQGSCHLPEATLV